ncbi:MAG: YifB family Mg chelatase-like AAA ATPase [Candidatus Kerfeldbacteria bacterium]|nr:YifB family Mg chelatase-like AAA ATPase [Candidatus Kerfeldbacteria bacterium]
MPATIHSAAVFGLEARLVTVEVDLHSGLPKIIVVGLPDTIVQEAGERIRSAIKNAGFRFPYGRVTINLSPADWRKEGSGFDLPVALAVLMASGQLPDAFQGLIVVGQLGLTSQVRATIGVLAMATLARRLGRPLVVPEDNAAEAALIRGLTVIPANNLLSLSGIVLSHRPWPRWRTAAARRAPVPHWGYWPSIIGQQQAKRAMVIAAAGHHNVLLIGPPGAGKTLLAHATAELLPPLSEPEAIEVTTIYSVANQLTTGGLITRRPFRQPHHTASVASLVGGGRSPKPGELSLAHHGILFLDEFPEFTRAHIEALRQPLEDGTVTVSRVAGSLEFPAACLLIAAMNPCPCGWRHTSGRQCRCTNSQIQRYQRRLSGPVLDRFDLFVPVPPVPASATTAQANDDPRPLVVAARQRQRQRYQDERVTNSRIRGRLLTAAGVLSPAEQTLLQQAMERLQFSMRAHQRILRVARTIADLAGAEWIGRDHLAEALHYRPPPLLG